MRTKHWWLIIHEPTGNICVGSKTYNKAVYADQALQQMFTDEPVVREQYNVVPVTPLRWWQWRRWWKHTRAYWVLWHKPSGGPMRMGPVRNTVVGIEAVLLSHDLDPGIWTVGRLIPEPETKTRDTPCRTREFVPRRVCSAAGAQ